MKNLVIFLYFVFLFKLAFAQSLPSIPGLGNGTLGQGTEIATDEQERFQLAQADVLPDDLNLPELSDDSQGLGIDDSESEGGIKIGKAKSGNENNYKQQEPQQQDPNDLSVTTIPEVELPKYEDVPFAEEAQIPAMPTIEEPQLTNDYNNVQPASQTIEVNQFQKNNFATGSNSGEIEVLKPEDFQAITLDNLGKENKTDNQFPAVPDLGYNRRDEEEDSANSALSPEEREKQVQQLLDDLLPEEKSTAQNSPLIISKKKKEEVTEEPAKEEEVVEIDDGIAKDYENLGKPGRIGYKPITYSEDQLNEQFVKAAIIGNKQAVVDLLHSGRPANSRNKFGETPLMASIYNGHNEITELLLVEGADANIQDVRGNTPLHVSAARRNYFAAQQLIRNGSVIDARNRANDTPLLIATLNGSVDIVDLLIREGADVNKANDDGLTPLHIASFNGNIELVKYLLYVGANANMVTREGYKPYDLAYGRHLPVAQALATYTNAQKYVSKELPKIIQERNKKQISPQSNSSFEDPYIMFPKAYQEDSQEKLTQEQLAYEQEQYNWWAATKRGEESIQNIESTGVRTDMVNHTPVQELNGQGYANDMTGLVKQDNLKLVSKSSTVSYNDNNKDINNGEIILPVKAVQKFAELKNNINKDPKLEGRGIEFTEGKAPIVRNESLKRKTDNSFKKEAKLNYGQNNRASELGGIIKAPAPLQQKIISTTSPELKKQPLTSSVTFSVGSKYASMPPAQRKQWDIRLDRWVKSGFREYNMSETERQLWLKQKQILQAIYQSEFDRKVESLKSLYAKNKNISYSQGQTNIREIKEKPINKNQQVYYKQTPLSLQRKLANQKYRARFNSSVASSY
ncbi:MAG TPA: hypothetical protein DIV86_02620 [Alphaproteobacteria bacterium]|nr:hypothetical protein [Alphaproteobacteria bacterium]